MAEPSSLHKRYYRNKRVLVTGGAGFIGSHLVDRLVECGAHVTVLDNLTSGRIDNLSNSASKITFIRDDIRNANICTRVSQNTSHVFHLAALVSVPQSVIEPALCNDINIAGTQTLYEACKEQGVSNIVFSSSAAVYGPRNEACKETDKLNPQSPYAESKLVGEELGRTLAQQYNISIANLRYFNVHGLRQDPQGAYAGALAAFRHRLLNKEPLTIYGDGQQTRDFIPVTDVVTANLHAGMHPALQGQPINIASGKSVTLLNVIQKLEEDLDEKANITFQPTRAGDVAHSSADISRYRRLLSWRP